MKNREKKKRLTPEQQKQLEDEIKRLAASGNVNKITAALFRSMARASK